MQVVEGQKSVIYSTMHDYHTHLLTTMENLFQNMNNLLLISLTFLIVPSVEGLSYHKKGSQKVLENFQKDLST